MLTAQVLVAAGHPVLMAHVPQPGPQPGAILQWELVEAHRAVVSAQSARSVGAVRSTAILGHGSSSPLNPAQSAAALCSSRGSTEPGPTRALSARLT